MSLLPILTTFIYLYKDPNFNFVQSLPYLIPMCIPLMNLIPSLQDTLKKIKSLTMFGYKQPLSFTARINMRYWAEEPDSIVRNFSTVLWYWNSMNLTVNCKNLMEEAVTRTYYHDDDEDNKFEQPIFVEDKTSSFWSKENPSIHYKMWMERNSDREGNQTKELFLKIEFMESVLPGKIVEHINFIKKEAKRILSEQTRKQRILVSKHEDDKDSNKPGPSFMIYEFATTSTFSNFFCEEAQLVQKDLTYFLHSKQEYERLGKPWTYTILNEGPPGVGKTKLVKAIAKETGYTLIVINLSHIKNTQSLYEAFHTTTLGGEIVPHDKRLYYIPEVDTQICDVKNRQDMPIIEFGPELDPKKKLTPVTKPTLGEILNVLDGVPERHGHILVLDTNHLKTLDPALIRPGRVDRIINWKKMSEISLKQYLEHYYKEQLPKNVKVPNRIHSAAEIQSHVVKYETLKECCNAFKKK